jgi:hypothetical protein
MAAPRQSLKNTRRAITQFKKQFSGELPEQRDANLRVFGQLQNLYQRVTEGVRAAQDRKVVIQKRLTDLD